MKYVTYKGTKLNLTPLVMFPTILLVYLLFPTKLFYWDGIDFAQAIEDAPRLSPSLFHPNHLLYNVFGYLAYKTALGIGLQMRALRVLQATNSLLSVLASATFFHILKLTLRSYYFAVLLTLLFAFSATWWVFSTDANAYVPSVLFILISFALVHPARLKPRPLLLAVTFSTAMILHQLAVIFFPVSILGLLTQTSTESLRHRIALVVRFSVVAFVLTFAIYYYCFYLSIGKLNFIDFLRWLTSHSSDSSFTFNFRQSLMFTLRGHVRLFLSGRFNILKGLINPFIIALMVSLAGAVIFLCLQLPEILKEFREARKTAFESFRRARSVKQLCIVWILLYTVFLFFWLPHNTFYRLFYLPALLLLCGLALDHFCAQVNHQKTFRTAVFVAVIAVSNFLFYLFPYSHIEKYPLTASAIRMSKAWPHGTTIYYATSNTDNRLFKYLNPHTAWNKLSTPSDLNELENELEAVYKSGSPAWLDATAIGKIAATPDGSKWLSAHALEQTRYKVNDPAFNIEFIQIVP